jgi:glycosyltransferase involved in cell wall biosynthesis
VTTVDARPSVAWDRREADAASKCRVYHAQSLRPDVRWPKVGARGARHVCVIRFGPPAGHEVLSSMNPDRLSVLFVSPLPPSPPRSGSQARTHGLLTQIARDHDLTAISLHDQGWDAEEAGRAMRAYCREVVLVRNPNARPGLHRRRLQFGSWLTARSFQRRLFAVPGFQEALDRLLQGRRFDVVFLNFPYLAHYRLRQAPPAEPLPVVVVDSHDIGYDLARQVARSGAGLGMRLHAAINWRKLAREELAAYEGADGVCVCSAADAARLARDAPGAATVIIPNAADVESLQPRATDPPSDGRTVLFFGLLSTVPNVDGVLFFLREIWPRIAEARPQARCRIVGLHPPAAVRALAGPRVEVAGPVDDIREALASAAVIVVPLRLGSGTRLKIVEAWAMARPVVSTTLGAEGIDGVAGRDLLIADAPADFASAVVRVLDDSALGARLGAAGRRLAVERYSWPGAARTLLEFFRGQIARRASPAGAQAVAR